MYFDGQVGLVNLLRYCVDWEPTFGDSRLSELVRDCLAWPDAQTAPPQSDDLMTLPLHPKASEEIHVTKLAQWL